MKKTISLLVIFSFILSLTSFAFAGEVSNESNIVYDYVDAPIKTFSPTFTNDSQMISCDELKIPNATESSGFYWSADTMLKGIGVFVSDPYSISQSISYTDSSKSTQAPIDYIYAKSKLYMDDTLIGSGIDSGTNSSFASATAEHSFTEPTGYWSFEAYGNHKFEESGYVSWYPETHEEN